MDAVLLDRKLGLFYNPDLREPGDPADHYRRMRARLRRGLPAVYGI
jgi:hypothetical protein